MNPRIGRPDKVDSIVESMRNDGYRPKKPMLVRPHESGYQIISGHHRWIAAQQAGIDTLPCWNKDLTDEQAYMELVLCNTQSELHPLEEGKHAAESGMDLKAYAEQAGKARPTLQFKAQAFRVSHETQADFSVVRDSWRNLAEIHVAPQWLWSALVKQMVESGWTVQVTRDKVGAFKDVGDVPAWADSGRVAESLVSGAMKIAEVARLQKLVDNAKVTGEFRSHLLMAIESESPSFLNAESYFGGEGDIGGRNYAQCAKYGIGREVIAKMLDGTEKEGAIQQALASLPLTARRKRGLELQAEEERRKAEELRAEADRINAEREQSRIAAPQNLSPIHRLFFVQR